MYKDWYFAENYSPSNEVADKLIDSKFGISKISSFVREIVQNSLDARGDDSKTVRVSFSVETFKLNEIPGGERLKEIIERCLSVPDLNHQTKDMYERGLEVLKSDSIRCLKISDENTIGVEPGLDKAWGAFVYDEGVSRKNRPGSAGNHGVGKKAPFIISGVHTVFYSTNYNGIHLFEGKTSLVNWNENGKDYDSKGWFGSLNKDDPDRRQRIKPIEYNDGIEGINDFFTRKEGYGTDVIIVDSSSLGDEKEAKEEIIVSTLENFFVAIHQNKLVFNVFGEEIGYDNINDILNRFYLNKKRGFTKKKSDSNNIFYGNLKDYYDAYINCVEPKKIDLIIDGVNYGYIEIYLKSNNEKNKKYYCIVREHGMKINDNKLNTEQPFTAVVIIKDNHNDKLNEKERINARLASRENAAHDDFIINDEQVPCDKVTENLINYMFEQIEKYIYEQTKVMVESESFLSGLDDMLIIPGITNKGRTSSSKPKVKRKKKVILKPGKGEEDENGKDGELPGEGNGHGGGGKTVKKKVRVDGDKDVYLYENFEKEPVILHINNKYVIKFAPNDSGKAMIRIRPRSVDGSETNIQDIILSGTQAGKTLSLKNNNIVTNIEMVKKQYNQIEIKLQDGLDYTLDCDVLVEELYGN